MVETTRCPECGMPAEVLDRHVLESTDGPVEHARVVCLSRHRFFLPGAGLAAQPSVAQWSGTYVVCSRGGRS